MIKITREKFLKLVLLFCSETIATAILLFIGCFGVIDKYEHFHPTHFTICLGFGLGVMISIEIFGCISGAHMNPILTLSAAIYKLIDIPTLTVYISGQFLGSYIGYALVRISIDSNFISNTNGFCVSLPNLDVGRAFVVEFIISFILTLIFCGVIDPRNHHKHDSLSLRFGLAVFILAFLGGTFSGGSMNPARSFGPALYNLNWESHWLYFVAPFSASIVATVMYRFVFYEKPAKVEKHESC